MHTNDYGSRRPIFLPVGLSELSENVAGGLVPRVELLRLAFGAVWLIDAYLKWQPAFINSYASSLAA